MDEKKQITVFTPTYNRAYLLSRCYESLTRQTNKSFLWLIVDDGSSDETEELVNRWSDEDIIEIHYYKQENGGKQRAHNLGVELCYTELFICVDSDDYLTDNAIESFIEKWYNIKEKNKISGIVAMKGTDSNHPLGNYLPTSLECSPLNKLYSKYGFKGDTALLLRTDVLKKYPFFIAEGEKFIGEGYIYQQIDQKYSLYLLNKILCICEYLDDGYSANVKKLIRNNPIGYMILNKQEVLLSESIKNKYLNSIRYIIGCIISKEKNPIKNATYKVLALLAYPSAIVLYFLRYKKC